MSGSTVCQSFDWQLRDNVLPAHSNTSLAWEWDTVELNAFVKMHAAQSAEQHVSSEQRKIIRFSNGC
jgi:hypothetical protein